MTVQREEMQQDIICIGSVLWDIVGRSRLEMRVGSDVPGRILRLPGGVAMNIAMTLVRFGLRPVLLTALGNDDAGAELRRAADAMGMDTGHIHILKDYPTDSYMAVEGSNGLIAAIADAHSLEAAGSAILTPLVEGPLARLDAPYEGVVALDGNLTEALLAEISVSPAFARADLRIAPASPGKAKRLRHVAQHPQATLYVNVEEAELITGESGFENARQAAEALLAQNVRRAVVTHGAARACDASQEGIYEAPAPAVTALRITGAGDTFMAAHIAAEMRAMPRDEAIRFAQQTAAKYVAGEDHV